MKDHLSTSNEKLCKFVNTASLRLFSSYLKVQQCIQSINLSAFCKFLCVRLLEYPRHLWTIDLSGGGYRGGSPTAVQAWQPCPLWELSPSHPILL